MQITRQSSKPFGISGAKIPNLAIHFYTVEIRNNPSGALRRAAERPKKEVTQTILVAREFPADHQLDRCARALTNERQLSRARDEAGVAPNEIQFHGRERVILEFQQLIFGRGRHHPLDYYPKLAT